MRKLLFYTLAIAAIATTSCKFNDITSAANSKAPTVRVGYLPIGVSLPFWIADAKGYDTDRGVDIQLVEFATADDMMKALLAGTIQATSPVADKVIIAAIDDEASPAFEIFVQVLLTEEDAFDAIIVPANSDITSITDLANTTIACFPGSQLASYLEIILQDSSVDRHTVSITQLPPQQMLSALGEGTVDAAFALEPIITLGESRGLTRTLVGGPIVKYVGKGQPISAGSAIINFDWATQNPALADSFVAAIHEAIEFVETDYTSAAAYYPEFTIIPANIASQVAIPRFLEDNELDVSHLQREANALRRAGLIDKANIDNLRLHGR